MISPYRGQLVDLLFKKEEKTQILKNIHRYQSIKLSPRQVCDLELLSTGAFSPLTRFMGKKEYMSVVKNMRLADGTLFPIPITLPVEDEIKVKEGQNIILKSPTNELLAQLKIEEIFSTEFEKEAKYVYQTLDFKHPLISEMSFWGKRCISGSIKMINLPKYFDFPSLRLTPRQVRTKLKKNNWQNIIAFQTRNPAHRAHEELIKKTLKKSKGVLLFHPAVGLTKPGDFDHYTRVLCYQKMIEKHLPSKRVLLSLIPLAMRFAGPRSALWHAIIRRNYGANCFIVGRDHASPGVNSDKEKFYKPYEAQRLVKKYASEIGIQVFAFKELVYLPKEKKYQQITKIERKSKSSSISGSVIRNKYLNKNKKIPSWLLRPGIAKILKASYLPKNKKGLCVWFTGLPCSGKSTIANILINYLTSLRGTVTLLDGDVVRTHLSKGLGFSRVDRDINILRIGFVASEVVRHNGVVICAAISPFKKTRNQVRSMIGVGKFILVHVDTPLKVCEKRDVKGLYKKARRGEIKNFTGVDDDYQRPKKPDLRLITVKTSPEKNALKIVKFLAKKGFLSKDNRY